MKNSILALSVIVFIISSCASVPQEAKPVGSLAAKPASDTAIAASKKVQLLFVQNAKNVAIKNNTMTLQGVSPDTIYFADRPDRITGHMITSNFIKLWGRGNDNFTAVPPNATLSVLSNNKILNVVMELRNPRINGDALTYEIKLLQGATLVRAGACSLFIDARDDGSDIESQDNSTKRDTIDRIEPQDNSTKRDTIERDRRIVPHDDATKYDTINRRIVPHDDATKYDTINRRIVPHDDATKYDTINRRIVPHDDATKYDTINRRIVPHDDPIKRDNIDNGRDSR